MEQGLLELQKDRDFHMGNKQMTEICAQTTEKQSATVQNVETDKNTARDKTILVITRNGTLSEPVMEYAVNVANRLDCKLLVAYVNTLPLLGGGVMRGNKLKAARDSSIADFTARAGEKNVPVGFVQESGRVSQVIHRLCHIVKRVEFVVIDQQINVEKAASGASVPVFNVLSGNLPVTKKNTVSRRAPGLTSASIPSWKVRQLMQKALFYGALTCALYITLFFQSELIMNYWTMGGIYGILPIITACVFFGTQALLVKNLTKLIKSRKAGQTKPAVLEARNVINHSSKLHNKQSRLH